MRLSITNSAKAILAAGVAAVLLLAACGGDDDSSDSGAAAADSGSGVVSVQSIDGTDVLVDSQGHALYSTEGEKGGKILCTASCTADWEPVEASGDDASSADVDADLGTVKRPDGTEQLTLNGLPLYRFTQEGPGELTGNGFVDKFNGTEFEWTAATVGGGTASPDTTTTDDGGGGYGY
jgi:predicted lipoprotein with Yx(FWY)xxD motif